MGNCAPESRLHRSRGSSNRKPRKSGQKRNKSIPKTRSTCEGNGSNEPIEIDYLDPDNTPAVIIKKPQGTRRKSKKKKEHPKSENPNPSVSSSKQVTSQDRKRMQNKIASIWSNFKPKNGIIEEESEHSDVRSYTKSQIEFIICNSKAGPLSIPSMKYKQICKIC